MRAERFAIPTDERSSLRRDVADRTCKVTYTAMLNSLVKGYFLGGNDAIYDCLRHCADGTESSAECLWGCVLLMRTMENIQQDATRALSSERGNV